MSPELEREVESRGKAAMLAAAWQEGFYAAKAHDHLMRTLGNVGWAMPENPYREVAE